MLIIFSLELIQTTERIKKQIDILEGHEILQKNKIVGYVKTEINEIFIEPKKLKRDNCIRLNLIKAIRNKIEKVGLMCYKTINKTRDTT